MHFHGIELYFFLFNFFFLCSCVLHFFCVNLDPHLFHCISTMSS